MSERFFYMPSYEAASQNPIFEAASQNPIFNLPQQYRKIRIV